MCACRCLVLGRGVGVLSGQSEDDADRVLSGRTVAAHPQSVLGKLTASGHERVEGESVGGRSVVVLPRVPLCTAWVSDRLRTESPQEGRPLDVLDGLNGAPLLSQHLADLDLGR